MTLILDGCGQTKESSLTKVLRLFQQLNSKVHELEQQHQDYVHQQQNLISAIAERKCFSDAGNRSAADSDLPGRVGVSAVFAIAVGEAKEGFVKKNRRKKRISKHNSLLSPPKLPYLTCLRASRSSFPRSLNRTFYFRNQTQLVTGKSSLKVKRKSFFPKDSMHF